MAGDHRHDLEARGLAYGDPLLALGTLEGRLGEAQAALKELEAKRMAFLAAQAKAQVCVRAEKVQENICMMQCDSSVNISPLAQKHLFSTLLIILDAFTNSIRVNVVMILIFAL